MFFSFTGNGFSAVSRFFKLSDYSAVGVINARRFLSGLVHVRFRHAFIISRGIIIHHPFAGLFPVGVTIDDACYISPIVIGKIRRPRFITALIKMIRMSNISVIVPRVHMPRAGTVGIGRL